MRGIHSLLVATTFLLLTTFAQAQAGVLRVSSFPSGANVVVDDVNTGKVTPDMYDAVFAGIVQDRLRR